MLSPRPCPRAFSVHSLVSHLNGKFLPVVHASTSKPIEKNVKSLLEFN